MKEHTEDTERASDITLTREDEELERLGYKHELRREFRSWSTISFATSIQGCVATIASTINTPLLLGGPATTIWAWFFGSFGGTALAISVAELISAYPTAGGIYTSSAFVIPARLRPVVCWIIGWITLISQLATTASVNFATAEMILAAVVIGTDGAYVPTPGQTIAVYVGLNFAIGIFDSLPTKWLHKTAQVYAIFNGLGTIIVTLAVPIAAARAGTINPSNWVWGSIIDQTGYSNRPFAFFLGILSVAWVLTDYDGTAHLSEEIKNASTVAPVAIMWAVGLTTFFGFWLNVALMYGAGDFTALPGPTGMAFAQILWNNLGTVGTMVIWIIVIIVELLTGVVCQLACIRSIYALSRDRLLPDFQLLARVSPLTKTPINASIFTAVIASLLGLLYLGSPVAINAVFSVTAVGLDVTYAIPTAFRLLATHFPSWEVHYQPGPFSLGRWSYWICAYAVVWTAFEAGILVMPQVYPVNAQTMNYAGPILGFVIAASFVWYLLRARKWYIGPAGGAVGEAGGRVPRTDSETTDANMKKE
ncbi:amino acid transporter [Calocera viscosa TUFC12733]|uniref:Amino acid transporter n=1 Tax=Calocera viscosa (strain TUFC12733) TaxID=1330018 RepID=A0A167ID94_CALVF|nr:amino acid transporter [Calocera viscosa TUFC12733]